MLVQRCCSTVHILQAMHQGLYVQIVEAYNIIRSMFTTTGSVYWIWTSGQLFLTRALGSRPRTAASLTEALASLATLAESSEIIKGSG